MWCRPKRDKLYFIGPEVGGFISSLEEEFFHAGYQIEKLYYSDPLQYSQNLPQNTDLRSTPAALMKTFIYKGAFKPIMQGTAKFLRFIKILVRAHGIIFNFGTTLFNNSFELAIYRFFRIRTIFVFHGSEIRPVYLNGKEFPLEINAKSLMDAAEIVRFQGKLAARAEKYADAVVAWAGITHFFSKPLFLHEVIGFPIQIPKTETTPHSVTSKTHLTNSSPLILHAPTHLGAKGTLEIRQIVSELLEEGLDFRYEELIDKSNANVLQRLSESSIVIDQIYSDSACGVFAAEAGLRDNFVVIAGQSASYFNLEFPFEVPPTYFVQTENVKSSLRSLIIDLQERGLTIPSSLRKYLEVNWNAENVATKYIKILNGECLAVQKFEPLKNEETFGGAASWGNIKSFAVAYTARNGLPSLGLDHNPNLRDRLINKIRD